MLCVRACDAKLTHTSSLSCTGGSAPGAATTSAAVPSGPGAVPVPVLVPVASGGDDADSGEFPIGGEGVEEAGVSTSDMLAYKNINRAAHAQLPSPLLLPPPLAADRRRCCCCCCWLVGL